MSKQKKNLALNHIPPSLPFFSQGIRRKMHTTTLEIIGKDLKIPENYGLKIHEYRLIAFKETSEESLRDFLRKLEMNIRKYKWKDIKELTVDFYWLADISSGKVKTLVQTIKRSLPRLERFSIRTGDWSKIFDEGLILLCQALYENMSFLTHISLELHARHRITDKGIKEIAKGVSCPFNKLKNISLSIYDGQEITNKGVKVLIKAISRYLIDLEKLSILLGPSMNFYKVNLTNDTVKILMENIGKRSKKLEDLSIDLFGHQHITKDCMQSLTEHFDYLPRLKINKFKIR